MIEFRAVSKAFGRQQVLEDVNLAVPPGAKLCLVGGSGSGKSVLCKLLLGLEQPDAGEICIEGRATDAFQAADWRELMQDFGVVFQGAALFDFLTVEENVGIRLFEEGKTPRAQIRLRVLEALRQVNLGEEVLEKYPQQLSGGMRKRVGIARAIIHRPRYLIFDEPTTGLDPVNSAATDQLIELLASDPSRTTLIVTHDMETVRGIATHVAMIAERRILFSGETGDFFRSELPAVRAFLSRGNFQT
jgi:phospholipid/cholesterol/gamma-HCH transport system ATP-binding protein